MKVVNRRQYWAKSASLRRSEFDSCPTYLRFIIYCSKGIEQLEGSDDFALQEDGRDNGCCRPVSGARWHFEEPLFQWELTKLAEAVVTSPKYRCHYPGYEAEKREDRSGEIRKEFRTLDDCVDRREDGLSQDR